MSSLPVTKMKISPFSFFLKIILCQNDGTILQRQELTQTAKCNDGTIQASFVDSVVKPDKVRNIIIFMEGGGVKNETLHLLF